jgi:hypothetical protein
MSSSQPHKQSDDLDQLAAQIQQLAESRNLIIVPAIPIQKASPGFIALLDDHDMVAASFCDLAAAAGARLLYLEADPFDAETHFEILEEDDGRLAAPQDAAVSALRQKAARYNGRIGELALGFAVEGVLHYWITNAPWYVDLATRVEELESKADLIDQGMPEAEAQAMITRLAAELLTMPEFRSAATAAQRHRIARSQHTEIAAIETDTRPRYRYLALQAIRQAEEQLAAEAEQKYREIEGALGSLAVEFEASPTFRGAGSARARREHAPDFLAAKAGGYPPQTRLLELFLDTPPLQRARSNRR